MTHSYPKTRLFVEPDASPPFQHHLELLCEGDAAHYLTRVMRLKVGDAVAVFNGRDGEWRAELMELRKKSVLLRLQEQLADYIAPPDVWVCFAPIKFGRIDFLVQKMTELGAARLIPTITQYTHAERVKDKRLRANAIEAAEQCERVDVPEIREPVQLRQLLADWPHDRLLLLADESGQGCQWQALCNAETPEKWAILIGPEGGFSEEERRILYAQPFVRAVSLGPRILRADTAAITLLALTQSSWGDWHIAPHFRRVPEEG